MINIIFFFNDSSQRVYLLPQRDACLRKRIGSHHLNYCSQQLLPDKKDPFNRTYGNSGDREYTKEMSLNEKNCRDHSSPPFPPIFFSSKLNKKYNLNSRHDVEIYLYKLRSMTH